MTGMTNYCIAPHRTASERGFTSTCAVQEGNRLTAAMAAGVHLRSKEHNSILRWFPECRLLASLTVFLIIRRRRKPACK